MTDHDRLYKELLTTFFPEFLQLFLPRIFTYLDKDSLTFIDKEIFSSVGTREKYEVDLVVKARIKQTGTVFLIHTEAQSHKEPDFDRRMFRYFARLYENHGLRVYPIALLSFDEPQIKQPSQHIVRFPDLDVLKFNYRVVQLNRLDHKKFLKERNPIAAALIGKMNIARKDYPKVRLECMKMLSGLNLDDARKRLIVHFIGTYLKLNREEKKEYEDRLAKMAKPEKEAFANHHV